MMNPTFYGLEDSSFETINTFLSEKVDSVLEELARAKCIGIEDDVLAPRTLGRICSYYYLRHTTARIFSENINETNDIPSLLSILCNTSEYEELPVRHNEEKVNAALAVEVPWAVDSRTFDSPHTKAHLLLQAHFSHLELPISDFITDTKSVLDQAVRIIQAMVDVAADGGWLFTALNTMNLLQMVIQGQWHTDSTLLILPHITDSIVKHLNSKKIETLAELIVLDPRKIRELLPQLNEKKLKEVLNTISMIPSIDVEFHLNEQETGPGEELVIRIELFRKSRTTQSTGAFTPRFPKRKDEGYWLFVGNTNTGELLALRRVNFADKKLVTSLSFEVPKKEDEYQFCLYVISDCYLGLDQQYNVKFRVSQSAAKSSEKQQPAKQTKKL